MNDSMTETPIKVLFLGLARDCAKTIQHFFAYLERLEADGLICTAIIGENGSFDQTRTLIEKAVSDKVALLDTSEMEMSSSRLARMAIGRQSILDAAVARGIGEDYVCVVDLDNIASILPDSAALRAAVERLRGDGSLFAIGATSSPVYYDLLSLRAAGFEFLSSLNCEIKKAKKRLWSYYSFHRRNIYRNQRLVTDLIPMKCESSFNGFCCYRASDYRLGSYRSADEVDVCEHVNFNLSIAGRTGRKMFIAKELVIQAPADHIPVNFIRFWLDRIRERLPKLLSVRRQGGRQR